MQTRLNSQKRKPDESSSLILDQLKKPRTKEIKENKIVFYDPASVADMAALEKASQIEMLGDTQTKEKWPILIYNSQTGYRFGVVAKTDIKKGDVIFPYLGDLLTLNQEEELDEKQQAYAYQYDENVQSKQYILGHERGSTAVFVNHSAFIPNVYCEKVNGTLQIKALCDIPKGCALLLNYGTNYNFTTRPLYLCPYRNGKTPTANFQENKKLYEQRKIKLTDDLKRLFNIASTSLATHLIVPKIYQKPTLLKSTRHKNLPIYLARKVRNKTTIMREQNQPYLSSLLLATAERDSNKINKLLAYGVDVFSETNQHVSVLGIAAKMLLVKDDRYSDFEKSFLLILTKIHTHFKKSYEKHIVQSKFLSYIDKHIDADNIVARDLIKATYPPHVPSEATREANNPSRLLHNKNLAMAPMARQHIHLLAKNPPDHHLDHHLDHHNTCMLPPIARQNLKLLGR